MAWDWDKLQSQRKSNPDRDTGIPPGIEDVFEKIKRSKGKLPGGMWLIILAAIIIFLGSSCFYTVGVNEVGVVQRFGKFERITKPGLNFKLPRGIEKVTNVKVDFVFKEEFGLRTLGPGVRTRYAPGSSYLNESLMLTGDLNVAVVPWIVQYRIKDPYKYLFKVNNVTSTLRDLAESSMRLIVGDSSINEVISKREEIAIQAKNFLQKELDNAETGIKIVAVEMKKTNVPEPVQPSFNEVNQATQEKEKVIYQAKEQYNKVIPAAKGDAEKTIRSAEGYALDRVNRAEGDVSRFRSLYTEYAKSKDVTRKRLYLEAIEEILPKLGEKYIVDANQKNLLPLLNLGKSQGGSK
ncbi:MAG TPA: FtsH protease activity modulator HflK [Desulfobacteraceae bacterium]|nr:FtsH protease activity modulator HflK [Desulfobacteraceae bacterium]HPJ68482.1 FtsH protease activity modulator HflK [Desulfobacteraceae bacterium]HPQ29390.1 FtsH protease activity modulator HflK [Desulfobacteraceae bacterium]